MRKQTIRKRVAKGSATTSERSANRFQNHGFSHMTFLLASWLHETGNTCILSSWRRHREAGCPSKVGRKSSARATEAYFAQSAATALPSHHWKKKCPVKAAR